MATADPNRSPAHTDKTGAYAAETEPPHRRRRLLWLLLALLALAIIAAILIAALSGGSSSKKSTHALSGGTLTVDGRPLVAGSPASKHSQVGHTALGRGVVVEEVTQQGFFVKAGNHPRVYVEDDAPVPGSSSTPHPAVGDHIDITGPIATVPAHPSAELHLSRRDAVTAHAEGIFIDGDGNGGSYRIAGH